MINIKVTLTADEIEQLTLVKLRKDFLFKSLTYKPEDSEKEITVGLLEVFKDNRLVSQGDHYVTDESMFVIKITLGQHPKNSLIRTVAGITYNVLKEEIDHTLFGTHMLVNTIDGKRVQFEIVSNIE